MPTHLVIRSRRVLGALLAAGALVVATRPSSAHSAPAASASPEPVAAAVTHRVRMVGDEKGYRFEPAQLTIAPGDRVTFVLVSGAPHNVQFDEDSIPAAARARLVAAMPDPVDDLMGPMLMADGETYTISFAGLPTGTYRYFCTPHVAMDMFATIVVRAPAKGK